MGSLGENLNLRESGIVKSGGRKESDFRYFTANQEDINDSINRSSDLPFKDVKLEDLGKPHEFGEFGVFKSPKSKFAKMGQTPVNKEEYEVEHSSEEEGAPVPSIPESDAKENRMSNINVAKLGPRIRRAEPRVFEKFDNSSVHIYKSEFKSVDHSYTTSKVNEGKSDETSNESEHLKVFPRKKGRSEPETRDKSRDSLSSLKGSMISEIFCLDSRKKSVPPSKFSQKMRKNSKYIQMVQNLSSVRHLGSLKSEMISKTTLSENEAEPDQASATHFFFKALVRLSKIFLEKLGKPRHSLKCLVFLEKNHQVDSLYESKASPKPKSSPGRRKKVPYLRINASSDSIEDYIRETQNKVSHLYSPGAKKTRLSSEQASFLFFLLGKTYLALEEFSKAEEKLVLSHVYDKSSFEPLFVLAQMHVETQNFRRAERYFRKAHYNDLGDNRAILGIADCNIREKNYDFLAQFAKSLDLDSLRDPRICLLFALGLLKLLSKSNLYPTNHNKELYFTLLRFLRRAEDCLRFLRAPDPRFSEAQLRNQIAQKYFKIKEFQAGIDCLNHLAGDSMTPLTLYHLAYAHFKSGNLSHSIGFLERVLAIRPAHLKSLLLKAEICKKKGDLKVAQAILQKLIERSPLDPMINRMLGDIFKYKGSFFQAIEHYEVV